MLNLMLTCCFRVNEGLSGPEEKALTTNKYTCQREENMYCCQKAQTIGYIPIRNEEKQDSSYMQTNKYGEINISTDFLL